MHKNGGVKTAVFFVLWGGLALQMRTAGCPRQTKMLTFQR
jgi:hypothetical protein